MAAQFRYLVFFAGILATIAVISGCISLNIGSVGYSGENLTFTLENTGDSANAFVQVTAYHLSAFSQEEYLYVTEPVALVPGTNRITIPVKLPSGNYKLYIYIIQDGERKAAGIRDIGV